MKTILVVEDTAIFRELIETKLRQAGYRTVTAMHGKDALEKMDKEKPDLILLDWEMPVMDGLAFLKRVRENPAMKSTPVVVLTGVSDKQAVLEAAKLKIQSYLLKSRITLKELLDRIKQHLDEGK